MRHLFLGLPLALAGGCSDYGLNGRAEAPASATDADSGFAPAADSAEEGGGGGSGADTDCPDSGLPPAQVELSAVEADPDASLPVCSAVGAVDWTMTEEWSAELPGFSMAALVAPNPDTGAATVIVDSDGHLLEYDGRDGAVLRDTLLVADPGSGDDGSTAAVADADGDGDQDVAVPTWGSARLVDLGTGIDTSFELARHGETIEDDELALFADVDLDGAAELVLCSGVYDLDGRARATQAPEQFTQTFVTDLTGDGFPEWVNGRGIWDPRDGSGVAFPADLTQDDVFYAAPFDHGGGAVGLADRDDGWSLLRADGTELGRSGERAGWGLVAIGDVDGDGVEDVVRIDWDHGILTETDLDGRRKRGWTVPGPVLGGGVSLADLDADGVYEIVLQTNDALKLLDGRSGAMLASLALGTAARDSAPAIADVDGDGSAEIVIIQEDWTAEDWYATKFRVVVVGPETGRWARTRPLWNQLPYDAASIRDDGTLVRLGTPGWKGLHAFRAQPARDGAAPDLTVALTAVREEVCGEAGVAAEVIVRNVGATVAPAGATLRLSSWDGAARKVLYEAQLPEPLPPGSRVIVTWRAPLDAVGLAAEIEPVGPDCDPLDDEAELLPL